MALWRMTHACALYPLQNGHTPLHIAISMSHTAFVEHLLSVPGFDVNTKVVSWFVHCTYHVCLIIVPLHCSEVILYCTMQPLEVILLVWIVSFPFLVLMWILQSKNFS